MCSELCIVVSSVSFILSFIVPFSEYATGGVFGLFVALTGERMPGGAVAMAEGNALGKGPVIFHLFDSGIDYIRSQAAGEVIKSCHT